MELDEAKISLEDSCKRLYGSNVLCKVEAIETVLKALKEKDDEINFLKGCVKIYMEGK